MLCKRIGELCPKYTHSRAWMQSSDRIEFLAACASLGSGQSYIVFQLSNCKDLNAYTYVAIYS